jgi:hypothetical protein
MSHFIKLANQLDNLDFPEVIKIIELVEDGKYKILPWITKIYSPLPTINPHNLCRCCRTEILNLPVCINLSDQMLINLPYIKSLTICSSNNLTPQIFRHLNYLEKLQILSHQTDKPDTLINEDSVNHLPNLQYLHVMNNIVTDDSLRLLKNLRVLVIDSTNPLLTPNVVNHLPRIELCIINRILYKYVNSKTNLEIIKKIGKCNKITVL